MEQVLYDRWGGFGLGADHDKLLPVIGEGSKNCDDPKNEAASRIVTFGISEILPMDRLKMVGRYLQDQRGKSSSGPRDRSPGLSPLAAAVAAG